MHHSSLILGLSLAVVGVLLYAVVWISRRIQRARDCERTTSRIMARVFSTQKEPGDE